MTGARAVENCTPLQHCWRHVLLTHPILLPGEVQALPRDALHVLASGMLPSRCVHLLILIVCEHLRKSPHTQSGCETRQLPKGLWCMQQASRSLPNREFPVEAAALGMRECHSQHC